MLKRHWHEHMNIKSVHTGHKEMSSITHLSQVLESKIEGPSANNNCLNVHMVISVLF